MKIAERAYLPVRPTEHYIILIFPLVGFTLPPLLKCCSVLAKSYMYIECKRKKEGEGAMVNFINILCADFSYKCFAQIFSSYVLAL